MNAQQLLLEAGLHPHEVQVYLALIQLGEATAGQIAKKTIVPRTYTYKILDALIERGFVRTTPRSIRSYTVTDFDAIRRYLEQKQLSLHRIEREALGLKAYFERLANPEASGPVTHELKDSAGKNDFWTLLHSTITREIWVIAPPVWWSNPESLQEVRKWEQYRTKQHIWEKRYLSYESALNPAFTETKKLHSFDPKASLFLIDQYQVQVTSWEPFRALQIESQEVVGMMKKVLEQIETEVKQKAFQIE